jgi:DNA-binding LacI/PurR family transcriptional regulator
VRRSTAPRIKDVAARAGVSTATVSYIISGRTGGKTRISEATRTRVVEAIRDLGYIPDATAQSLRTNRTNRISLVIPSIGAPYWYLLAEELIDEADALGYQVVVSVVGTERRENRVFEELLRGFADGAIVAGTCYWKQRHFSQLAARGIAVTAISGTVDPDGFDIVRTKEHQAREDAVDHLLGKGCRRIAILTDSTNAELMSNAEDYLSILTGRGHSVDDQNVASRVHNRETAHTAVKMLLQSPAPPDAILAVADVFAIGALMAAKDLDIDVPTDLAIVGAGNVPETEITTPPLTTVGQETLRFEMIGELLFSRLKSEEVLAGRVLDFPRVLIKRGST